MFNLEFTITLPLFLLFLSQLPPPIWDCRSFCFSQILSSLTFLLTCHTSIAISWISAELSAKVRRKLEGNSPNILSPQTYTLPGSTHPSHSFLEHSYSFLERDIEIITSKHTAVIHIQIGPGFWGLLEISVWNSLTLSQKLFKII